MAAVETPHGAHRWSTPPAPGSPMCFSDVIHRPQSAGQKSRLVQGQPYRRAQACSTTADWAYILQNTDKRIVFVIPYERDFSLVGTTDVAFEGDVRDVRISDEETDYLCAVVNRYFSRRVTPADVVWSYSGVRSLYDDSADDPSSITRDYVLELDAPPGGAPLLSVFGGKITTFRKLAEAAMAKLRPAFASLGPDWTGDAPLPGGAMPDADFELFLARLHARHPWLPARLALRLARAYGTLTDDVLGGASSMAELGRDLGGGLSEAGGTLPRLAGMGARSGRHPLASEQSRPAHRAGDARCTGGDARRPAGGRVTDVLALEGVERTAGGARHLWPIDLALPAGSLTVLLGRIRAGKTSLLRLMAGLDKPSAGRVISAGVDVTGADVRRRDVAMVYQQFINYPTFSVRQNIASPLRVRGTDRATREGRVADLAARLGLMKLLDRKPSELSGGQQQRVALARAMAKDARLLLLDEPLVNLDYKLREELRAEMRTLFSTGDRATVYASTEPAEALLLGGRTAVLDQGRLLQVGRALDVYLRPATLEVARLVSDPPMNVFAGTLAAEDGPTVRAGSLALRAPSLAGLPAGRYTFGLHAADLHLHAAPGRVALPFVVSLAEINGSETLLHGSQGGIDVLVQTAGVHRPGLGDRIDVHVDVARLYAFAPDGTLVHAPNDRSEGRHGADRAA